MSTPSSTKRVASEDATEPNSKKVCSISTSPYDLPPLLAPFFAPKITLGEPLPKLIIVDLDYTLWSCYVWEHTSPPYKRIDTTDTCTCTDPRSQFRGGQPPLRQTLSLYNHVRCIVEMARRWNIKLAIASKSKGGKEHARIVLQELDLWGDSLWSSVQIIPNQAKSLHVSNILRETCTSAQDAIFFDDEEQNVRHVLQRNGVLGTVVDKSTGLDAAALCKGLSAFRSARLSQSCFNAFFNRFPVDITVACAEVSATATKTITAHVFVKSPAESQPSQTASTAEASGHSSYKSALIASSSPQFKS
jgi:magnesium-dependent phosphatase-1